MFSEEILKDARLVLSKPTIANKYDAAALRVAKAVIREAELEKAVVESSERIKHHEFSVGDVVENYDTGDVYEFDGTAFVAKER